MIKKIILFIFCYCFITSCYAADNRYPVDTVALDEALREITRVGDSTDVDTVENAQVDLSDYFLDNAKKKLPVTDIRDKCVEIVQHKPSCKNFLDTYGKYLDHVNFCIKANNITVKYVDTGKEYSFKECYSTIDNINNTSEKEQCERWIDYGEKCSAYLSKLYKQILSDKKLSKTNKKNYYECLSNKVQTGNIDVPIQKMEEYCEFITQNEDCENNGQQYSDLKAKADVSGDCSVCSTIQQYSSVAGNEEYFRQCNTNPQQSDDCKQLSEKTKQCSNCLLERYSQQVEVIKLAMKDTAQKTKKTRAAYYMQNTSLNKSERIEENNVCAYEQKLGQLAAFSNCIKDDLARGMLGRYSWLTIWSDCYDIYKQ